MSYRAAVVIEDDEMTFNVAGQATPTCWSSTYEGLTPRLPQSTSGFRARAAGDDSAYAGMRPEPVGLDARTP